MSRLGAPKLIYNWKTLVKWFAEKVSFMAWMKERIGESGDNKSDGLARSFCTGMKINRLCDGIVSRYYCIVSDIV